MDGNQFLSNQILVLFALCCGELECFCWDQSPHYIYTIYSRVSAHLCVSSHPPFLMILVCACMHYKYKWLIRVCNHPPLFFGPWVSSGHGRLLGRIRYMHSWALCQCVLWAPVQVPLGISIAISIRVGNELGAGNPTGAQRACYVACGIISESVLHHTLHVASASQCLHYKLLDAPLVTHLHASKHLITAAMISMWAPILHLGDPKFCVYIRY